MKGPIERYDSIKKHNTSNPAINRSFESSNAVLVEIFSVIGKLILRLLPLAVIAFIIFVVNAVVEEVNTPNFDSSSFNIDIESPFEPFEDIIASELELVSIDNLGEVLPSSFDFDECNSQNGTFIEVSYSLVNTGNMYFIFEGITLIDNVGNVYEAFDDIYLCDVNADAFIYEFLDEEDTSQLIQIFDVPGDVELFIDGESVPGTIRNIELFF